MNKRGPRRPILARAILLGLLAGTVAVATGCDWFTVRVALRNGNQAFNERNYEEAITQYEKILKVQPDHWEANYYTAAAYMSLYHPGSTHPKDVEYSQKAIAAFKHCLDMGPPDPEQAAKVQEYYLGLLTSTEHHQEAAQFMEQLVAKDPQNVNLIGSLAQMYARQGDFPNALKYFERRTEVEPDNKEAWYTVGVVCWERSYKGGPTVSSEERGMVIDKGLAALERALAIDPGYFDALAYTNLMYREKSQWLAQLGRYDEAQQAFQMAEQFKARATEARDKGQQQQPQPTGAGS